jgi:putative ATP-binding cassette transporter
LEIVSSANADKLKEEHVVIKSGERVLILGAPGTGKTQLFRALAGLWPWGHGRIARPAGQQIFYLPRGTPYMPRGTLREVLAYPLKADNFPMRHSNVRCSAWGSNVWHRCSTPLNVGIAN